MKYLQKRITPLFILFVTFAVLGFMYKFLTCEGSLDTSIAACFFVLLHFIIQLVIVFNYEMIGYVMYLSILPKKLHLSKIDFIFSNMFFFVFSVVLLFSKMAEGLFWDEFGVSFNFIAVDYLIYTTEVVGNIRQSYPMGTIMTIIGIIAALLTCFHYRTMVNLKNSEVTIGSKKQYMCTIVFIIMIGLVSFNFYDASMTQNISDNKFNQEVCKNEAHSFFNAFINNKINYNDFYITKSADDNLKFLRQEFSGDNVHFINNKNLTRSITSDKKEMHKNVIVVVMESMDAKFMNENRTDHADITPNLTTLAENGIYFRNVYSTGTRTVRGLEAVTLCLPPQAGMAVVRQKNNDNLVNVGSIFKEKGYRTRWFYGGYGYFDNMNDYFRGNGFEITDRTDIPADKIHLATIWGVADEDLYAKVIEENNQDYDPAKPFFEVILTTSNHRPYDFPKGRIEIEPVKGGRLGAVKYADWAIGDFIEKAKQTKWFNDTVFVFVADHGSSSAGSKDLNLDKHRIPLIIYSPEFLKPQKIDKVISQIDTMPTVMALLNFSYESRLMGRNAFEAPDDGRFFISNYQCLGYAEKNKLCILKPVRKVITYVDGNKQDKNDEDLVNKAVAYYQYSSDWKGILHNYADKYTISRR